MAIPANIPRKQDQGAFLREDGAWQSPVWPHLAQVCRAWKTGFSAVLRWPGIRISTPASSIVQACPPRPRKAPLHRAFAKLACGLCIIA